MGAQLMESKTNGTGLYGRSRLLNCIMWDAPPRRIPGETWPGYLARLDTQFELNIGTAASIFGWTD